MPVSGKIKIGNLIEIMRLPIFVSEDRIIKVLEYYSIS